MKRIAIPLVTGLIVVLCCSWGFLVHRTVNQLAVYELPKPIQPFFYRHMDYLVKNAPRPDLRRKEDPAEAPKHYIDLEEYGDSAARKMPYDWNEAVARYSKDTLLKYGYVPYNIMMEKDRLTNAFRSGNVDSILFYAADLGHYIGDAHVPLHTTTNYDGQLTGQRGIHSLWETVIPEIEIGNYKLYSSHRAQYLSHPEEAVWQAVRQAHSQVAFILEQEKELSKSFTDATKYRVQMRNGREYKSYTSEFAKALSRKLGNTIDEQLLRSADMVADFWYTSWVDAGRPSLKGLIQPPFTKKDKKQLRLEYKAWKKNQLVQKKLLRAEERD